MYGIHLVLKKIRLIVPFASAVSMGTNFWTSAKDGPPGFCETILGAAFVSRAIGLITAGNFVVLRCHILVTSVSKTLYLLNFS